jgi:hypothetical protein
MLECRHAVLDYEAGFIWIFLSYRDNAGGMCVCARDEGRAKYEACERCKDVGSAGVVLGEHCVTIAHDYGMRNKREN